jgi:hypothetical protein
LAEVSVTKGQHPDAVMLSEAIQIAEKAFRLSVVRTMDPCAAVQQAAEELWLENTSAHNRVIEELSEAGTAIKGKSGAELFEGVEAQLWAALERAG